MQAADSSNQITFEYLDPDSRIFISVFALFSAIGLSFFIISRDWQNTFLLLLLDIIVFTQIDMPLKKHVIDPGSRTFSIVHKNLLADRVESFEFLKAKEIQLETYAGSVNCPSLVSLRLVLRDGKSFVLGGSKLYSQDALENLRAVGKKISALMCVPYKEVSV